MDCVAPAVFCDSYKLIDVKIGTGTVTFKGNELIGFARVQACHIVVRCNRDRWNTQLRGCSHNADRYFASIGD